MVSEVELTHSLIHLIKKNVKRILTCVVATDNLHWFL